MDTEKLRQKILDLAIHGKLVPQDPNDEPASKLLKMVHAEREKLVKEGKIKRDKNNTSDKSHYEKVPFDIPESWAWTTLGEISDYGQCSSCSVNTIPDDAWLLELEDIEKNTAKILQYLKKTDRVVKGVRHRFKRGELLFSKLRTYLNKVFVAQKDGYCSTEIVPISFFSNIKPQYICLVLKSNYFLQYSALCGYGVKMPRIGTADALHTFIPLPPINEQKRIISKIESLFLLADRIYENKKALEIIINIFNTKILSLAITGKLVSQNKNDESAVELLKRISPGFKTCDNSHYKQVPKGWCILNLGQVAEYTNGRAFKPEEWEKSGKPIIRIQNLNDVNAIFHYSTQQFDEKYLIKKEDLLFAWAASLGTFIWDGGDAWLNQHIFKVQPYGFLKKFYLYYLLKYLISTFYTKSHGSGMVHITKDKFEGIEILLPPIKEQNRIVEKIRTIYKDTDSIIEQIRAF
jgi:type I restriction enzyme S subunit